MIHKELTSKIIRSAMNVHNELGCGFQEVIYQRALEIEMNLCQLNFSREKEMEIYFHEQQIGTRRVDFFVEDIPWPRRKPRRPLRRRLLARRRPPRKSSSL